MTNDIMDYVLLMARHWREEELAYARQGDLTRAVRAHHKAIVLEDVLREDEQRKGRAA